MGGGDSFARRRVSSLPKPPTTGRTVNRSGSEDTQSCSPGARAVQRPGIPSLGLAGLERGYPAQRAVHQPAHRQHHYPGPSCQVVVEARRAENHQPDPFQAGVGASRSVVAYVEKVVVVRRAPSGSRCVDPAVASGRGPTTKGGRPTGRPVKWLAMIRQLGGPRQKSNRLPGDRHRRDCRHHPKRNGFETWRAIRWLRPLRTGRCRAVVRYRLEPSP